MRHKMINPIKKEGQIQSEILYYLSVNSSVKFYWRNNTGGTTTIYKGKSQFFRWGYPGSSDIIGIMGDGKFLAIEVKTEKDFKYLSKYYDKIKTYIRLNKRQEHLKKQIEFIERIVESNGVAFFACSTDIVIKELQKRGY